MFEHAPTPTQQEVASLVLDVHARVMRLLDKHGLLEVGAEEELSQEAPALAACWPPLTNDRLTKCDDGHYLLRLKAPWTDGTTHLKMEPIELMERLAAQK